jgi:hypothetical protein
VNSKRFGTLACIVAVALVAGTYAVAQEAVTNRLAGTINDYSAASGGWHVTAEWSLQLKGATGNADFSAAMTMVRSDLWVLQTGADPTDPELRTPHTHHVGIVDGVVTPLANGFRITGAATITSNGSPAGFSGSQVQVDITGGTAIAYSNVKLTFAGGAAGHFGTHPLDGVVVTAR